MQPSNEKLQLYQYLLIHFLCYDTTCQPVGEPLTRLGGSWFHGKTRHGLTLHDLIATRNALLLPRPRHRRRHLLITLQTLKLSPSISLCRLQLLILMIG